MSKVVHLSDDAHIRAKDFCRDRGLKMSDWVAKLIDDAITSATVSAPTATITAVAPEPRRNLMPKKKILERLDHMPQPEEENVPAWSRPPFWAGGQAQRK